MTAAAVSSALPGEEGSFLRRLPKRDYPTNLDDLPPLKLTVQDLLPAWALEPPPAKDYPTNIEGLPPLAPFEPLDNMGYPAVLVPLASTMFDAMARTAAASYDAKGTMIFKTQGRTRTLDLTHSTSGDGQTYVHAVQSVLQDGVDITSSALPCGDVEMWTSSGMERTRCNDVERPFTFSALALTQHEDLLPFDLVQTALGRCETVTRAGMGLFGDRLSDGLTCAGVSDDSLGRFSLTLWIGQQDGRVSSLALDSQEGDGDAATISLAISGFSEGQNLIPAY